MLFLILTADHADELAVWAPEDYRRALVLVREQFLVRKDLLTAFVGVAAPELDLAEEVSRHSIHSIKLTFISTIRARIWILHKPVRLAVTAEWFLAGFAFDWILEYIVANATDELLKEGFNMLVIVYLIFFIDKLSVLLRLINYVLHLVQVRNLFILIKDGIELLFAWLKIMCSLFFK